MDNEQNPPLNKPDELRRNFFGEWMGKLSAAFNQPVSEERQAIYYEALRDLSIEDLSHCFERVLLASKFFPSIAEIREYRKAADDYNAEKAWMVFKCIYEHHWHPDIGFHSNPPLLDAAGDHALRIVGGMSGFAQSAVKDESFVRRDFIQAYKRYRETGGYLGPSREEAARLLEQIQVGQVSE